jgi:hypothetical protein
MSRYHLFVRRLPLADRLCVREPCDMLSGWDEMPGDERTRFCGSCQRDVHDVSRLTRDQVETLLRAHDGARLCVRLRVRRTDGAILLADGHAHPSRQLATRSRMGALAISATAALTACTSQTAPAPAPADVAPATSEATPRSDAPPVVAVDPPVKDAEAPAVDAEPPPAPVVTTPVKNAHPKPKAVAPRVKPELYLDTGGYL